MEYWSAVYHVVVLKVFCLQVLALAYDRPLLGHLGITKTDDKVLKHFFWLGLKSDVSHNWRTCQVAGKPNQVIPPASLSPIPVMREPFRRVIVACVDLLSKSTCGNQFILTMCASSQFPEAVTLQRTTGPVITNVLRFFSVFGLPKVVQTDQEANFKSRTFAQALKVLGEKYVRSSSYHSKSQGALECFPQTLKSMSLKYCIGTGGAWDEDIPFVCCM